MCTHAASEVVITLIKLYADNYPEILKCCYIINGNLCLCEFLNLRHYKTISSAAPKVFAFAFNVVKKFLDEYTISKIQIHKADRSKWLPAILDKVDAKSLPAYFGGEMTDKDGNPKCEEKVWSNICCRTPSDGSVLDLLRWPGTEGAVRKEGRRFREQ